MLAPFECQTKVLKREAGLHSRDPAGLKPIDTLALDAGLALKHHFTVIATDAM
jgi:hypothetical protein